MSFLNSPLDPTWFQLARNHWARVADIHEPGTEGLHRGVTLGSLRAVPKVAPGRQRVLRHDVLQPPFVDVIGHQGRRTDGNAHGVDGGLDGQVKVLEGQFAAALIVWLPTAENQLDQSAGKLLV